jgi:3-hydroxyisobutyrate dehydrogenase-like beta-hydroxyacid dehydrogenase
MVTGGPVGFVGLGIMGRGMSRNLLAAGVDLVVWNRTAERMAPLVEEGAAAGESPSDVGARCDVVITCVSDTPDVEEVLLGDEGVAAGADEGTLVVDTSTISPEATRELAGRLGERGIGFVDAPISGGSEGAEQGTLSVMVGGDPEHVARARPCLETFASRITHVGPVGSGQAAKLTNQILVVTTMLGVSEALVFAAAQGLDLDRTLEAVTGGAAASWMLENRGPQVIAGDWSPGFTIDLQQKDLRLVLEAAEAAGVPVVATSLIHQLYAALQAAGLGGEGNHALAKAIERLACTEARRSG